MAATYSIKKSQFHSISTDFNKRQKLFRTQSPNLLQVMKNKRFTKPSLLKLVDLGGFGIYKITYIAMETVIGS